MQFAEEHMTRMHCEHATCTLTPSHFQLILAIDGFACIHVYIVPPQLAMMSATNNNVGASSQMMLMNVTGFERSRII